MAAELQLQNDIEDENGFSLIKELSIRKLSSYQVVPKNWYRKGRTSYLVHSFLQKNQEHMYTYGHVYLKKLSTAAYEFL